MGVEGLLGTEEERSARRLIEQAGALLTGRGGIPPGFVARLFNHAAPEDLVGYAPAELAALAEAAWDFLAIRKPGLPKIRFVTPQVPGVGERLKAISIIEIANDDMPFLVDSVMGELTERGFAIRLVVHPVFTLRREVAGRLQQLMPEASGAGAGLRESFIHIHVERVEDEIVRSETIAALEAVLADVRVGVADWQPMLRRVGELVAALRADPPPLPVDEIAEAIQFLEWLAAANFTFLGLREYVFAKDGELQPKSESGLGVLRGRNVRELTGADQAGLKREIAAFFDEPRTLMITKSNLRSRVHRRALMDYVGVKRFDRDGNAAGETRIVGLLTSTAYTRSTKTIPYLRRKVDWVLTRAGFDPEGHSGKALVNLLETYPRDELFQIDDETLYHFALAILQLDERPRVRVLARRDRFDRFASVLVYVPRQRAGTGVVDAIGAALAQSYQGHVSAFNLFFPEGPLVRIHFIIARSEREIAEPERASLEDAVSAVIRTWADALSEALALAYEGAKAKQLYARYQGAFSASYREHYPPATAIEDIRTIEGLSAARPLGVHFHGRPIAARNCAGLKVWSHGRPIPLSDRVPVLENMGFRVVDERTYDIAPAEPGAPAIWLHDMMLERADGGMIDLAELKSSLEATFLVVMAGIAENDGYNALVLKAGLRWRDVAFVRTISRYLRQIRVPFSQSYMWETLGRHAGVAARIVDLFAARFDPREYSPSFRGAGEAREPGIQTQTPSAHLDSGSGASHRPGMTGVDERAQREAAILAEIETALTDVPSLDEDRILRHFVNAVRAAIRTNFYQIDADGQPKPLIAVKFDSRKIDELPLPRPLYEIFVYSPRVEGVHLRFGKVARGGIRWSDRPQDFRTEILGLAKAQQVKNAVIVPVGAKGGFVPKLLPAAGHREAIAAEGVAAYKLFISSLLDITDNISPDSGVVPPPNAVRHDDDDPYLVVAADKGTASFSDIANAISLSRHFWLGDAFASGGSAGYDHKAMGITARGAWEAVKRHFREMDADITRTPFTVAGIGDMSGDVFGNGMLREKTIRLLAAFDHRDIFIDPDPDAEKSFAERARLFALPRSSWQDYDQSLISPGGGVFSRAGKEIPLSPQMQARTGIAAEKATPAQVIRAILKMPVDLLFFGGIGTYVRATAETDEAVGDRANDAVRVTGADLRCKAIGEGANLGMTQRGRVEAAFAGVRLNTDAIDNSAGVNTSDLEVNIKIALSGPVRTGVLPLPDRNALLGDMTEQVAALVLRNNYLQTLALSLAERRGREDLGFLVRLMQNLETRGQLDRAVEFLPDDMEIAERARRGQALARPELAVLLAYAKLALHADLLESAVPDDPYLSRELARYFPETLAERFPEALESHRLRRDIISTQLANSMINRGGPSLVLRMTDETGAGVDAVAAAFAAMRDSYQMPALNDEINALDGKVAGKLQLDLYAAVQDLLLDRLVWFLRNVDLSDGLAAIVEHYRAGIMAVESALADALPADGAPARAAKVMQLREAGVPEPLALRMVNLPALAAAPDIVLVADRTGEPVADAARTYFAARDYFRIDAIADAARAIEVSDYFDRLALDRARDGLGEAVRRLTAEMMADGLSGPEAVAAWVAARGGDVERIRAAVAEIAGTGLTLSKLSVAASLLGDLAKG